MIDYLRRPDGVWSRIRHFRNTLEMSNSEKVIGMLFG